MSSFDKGGGPFNGVNPPILPAASMYIMPQGWQVAVDQHAITTDRYYYYPFYLVEGQKIAGAAIHQYNTATANFKMALLSFTTTDGGALASVEKDFGSGSTGGTAGVKQLASAYTVSGTGWRVLAMVSDGTPSLYEMYPTGYQFSVAGYSSYNPMNMLGRFDWGAATVKASIGAGWVVDGTYANFPEASPLAPDETNANVIYPAVALYTAAP
jgi:hypothetical protein